MKREDLSDLIIHYLDDSASPDEVGDMLKLLKSDKKNAKLFVDLKDLWLKTGLLNNDDDKIAQLALLRFKYRLAKRQSGKDIRVLWMKYANIAAVLIITILSGILLFRQPERGIFSNELYTETVIPLGQKGKVLLSDGTTVTLNSGTKIKYPSVFNDQVREVYLEGEAYFEVARNKSRPFLVHSGKLTVKVLGTSFNLKSYPDENRIETTLVNGSVKILEGRDGRSNEIATLSPNEQAVYDVKKGKILVNKLKSGDSDESRPSDNRTELFTPSKEPDALQIESVYMWKDQKLIFEHETLEQMAQKLSRWYNKTIHIESENLKGEKYSGKFVYNETIYQVLEAISLTTNIQYYEKDHEIYIGLKDNQ